MKLSKNFLNHFFPDIKLIWKHQWMVVILFLITNVIKKIPKSGGSYTDSPIWIRIKKATINPINQDDDKCFQNTATFALNHKEIEKNSGQIP